MKEIFVLNMHAVSGATLMHVDRILGRDTRGPGTRYRECTIVDRGREHKTQNSDCLMMSWNQKAIMFLPSFSGSDAFWSKDFFHRPRLLLLRGFITSLTILIDGKARWNPSKFH